MKTIGLAHRRKPTKTLQEKRTFDGQRVHTFGTYTHICKQVTNCSSTTSGYSFRSIALAQCARWTCSHTHTNCHLKSTITQFWNRGGSRKGTGVLVKCIGENVKCLLIWLELLEITRTPIQFSWTCNFGEKLVWYFIHPRIYFKCGFWSFYQSGYKLLFHSQKWIFPPDNLPKTWDHINL